MNSLKRFIVPAKGVRVINPATHQPLPSDGLEVDFEEFWQRRVNDGDVSIREKPPTSNSDAKSR